MTDSYPDWDAQFTPIARLDTIVRQYGTEAVAWSAVADEPVFLDPVAALVLQIVDGSATLADLVEDIHDVLGIDPTIALQEVTRALQVFSAGGLLENSGPTSQSMIDGELFSSPLGDRVVAAVIQAEMSPIDLAIGERVIRVQCGGDDVFAALKSALERSLISQEAPLGFVLHVPTDRQRLYVLTDRSGSVLGRTIEREHALAMLGGHLSAFQTPKVGAVRFRARALVAPDGSAVLAPWPLLHVPPIVESKLAEVGYRIVDQLCVDVDSERGTLDHSEIPWPALRSLDPGPGHTSAVPDRCEVRGLLLPVDSDAAEPTTAQIVHYLAALTTGCEDRAGVLGAAEVLASMVDVRPLPADHPASVHEQLARYAAESSPSGESRVIAERSTLLVGEDRASMTIEESYDELPYGFKAFAETHPVQLSTTAELCGLATAPVNECRVLELGCGEGGNLIPVAEAYPEAEFLGVDLSRHQVARGNAVIRELGLSNIELRQLDISEMDDTFGRFDYIICHGVFSWVPGPVQEKILDICRENSAPGGVAFISYNTFPGWHFRGVLRKLMIESTGEIPSLVGRIAVARQVLGAIADDAERESEYGSILRALAESVLDQDDAYIAHEFLAPINTPLYHSEFVDRAAAHGLRWLGDQRVTANPSLVGHSLISVDPNDPARQEYNDILSGVGFRRAVLCRSDATLDPEGVPNRMQGFRVSSSLSGPRTIDLEHGTHATFTGQRPSHNPITIDSDSAVLKAALKHLERVSGSMSFAELRALVARDLSGQSQRSSDQGVQAVLARELLMLRALHGDEAVELTSYPYPFTNGQSARPRVSEWARWEALSGTTVTNLRNSPVHLSDALLRFVVQRLDGTRTVGDLAREAISELALGNLAITKGNGKRITPGGANSTAVRSLVSDRLASLARSAMLIA